ncbi:hypothetical protein [Hymenobacter radiodurans]|uniref:hypothetical protein n=1 Tax=Hymenobacter radiodurans TaxID=2496028 RepID=UPI001058509E|nr:hypothetical protein [Hymenobacter radiodurans]
MTELKEGFTSFGQWLSTAIQEQIDKSTSPLLKRIEQLEACTDEYVPSKTALKLTGIKSLTTLRSERERKDSLLKTTGLGRAIRYSRASCIAFCESKILYRNQRSLLGRANTPTL